MSRIYKDQIGADVSLPHPPKRIVSLVPSQTELLYSLGLESEVVGLTRFCVHPSHWKNEKQVIGGTKNVNIKRVEKLTPDLIIANKEENVKEQVEALRINYPVWTSQIKTLDDTLEMIDIISQMTEKQAKGRTIRKNIEALNNELLPLPQSPSVLYLIWKDPYMAAGTDTFINEMISLWGGKNILEEKRYPSITSEGIAELSPDYIFLSSEPYRFSEADQKDMREVFPNSKIILVNGEMFSWYGSRLLLAFPYLKGLREECGLQS